MESKGDSLYKTVPGLSQVPSSSRGLPFQILASRGRFPRSLTLPLIATQATVPSAFPAPKPQGPCVPSSSTFQLFQTPIFSFPVPYSLIPSPSKFPNSSRPGPPVSCHPSSAAQSTTYLVFGNACGICPRGQRVGALLSFGAQRPGQCLGTVLPKCQYHWPCCETICPGSQLSAQVI